MLWRHVRILSSKGSITEVENLICPYSSAQLRHRKELSPIKSPPGREFFSEKSLPQSLTSQKIRNEAKRIKSIPKESRQDQSSF